MASELEQKARELLDTALRDLGLHEDAYHVGFGAELDQNDRAAINAIVAALRAAPAAAGAPDGWKLVPIEPTDAMIKAGGIVTHHVTRAVQCYCAMIGAAATPEQRVAPAAQQGVGLEVDAVISAALSLIRDAEEFETADGLVQAAQLHLWHALEDAIERVGPAEVISHAARQPAGQECGYQVRGGIGEPWCGCGLDVYRAVGATRPSDARKVYAAPPAAQAVDLEQFRDCVLEARAVHQQNADNWSGRRLEARYLEYVAECDRLLALIDQQAGGAT